MLDIPCKNTPFRLCLSDSRPLSFGMITIAFQTMIVEKIKVLT